MNKTHYIKYTLISICLFLVVLVACLPTFLSTKWGKNVLLYALNNHFKDSTLAVDSLSLSWFGSQQITGISYVSGETNPDNRFSFSCASLSTDAPLWAILVKKLSIGSKQLPFSGNLTFEQANLELTQYEKQTPAYHVMMSNVRGVCTLSPDHTGLSGELSGQTKQDQLEGDFHLTLALSSMHTQKPAISVKADFQHFPVKGIDEMIAYFNPTYPGLLLESVGETLDLQCVVNTKNSDLDIQLSATSPNFNASIATTTTQGNITLKTPLTVTLNLTPALLKKISPSLNALTLQNTPSLTFTVTRFVASELRPTFFDCALDAQTVLSPLIFSMADNPTPIEVRNLKAIFSSTNMSQGGQWQASWDVTYAPLKETLGSPLSCLVEGTLNGLGSPSNSRPPIQALSVQLTSSLLKMEKAHFSLDPLLNLMQPVHATLASPFVPNTSIAFSLNSFELPLDKPVDRMKGSVEIACAAPPSFGLKTLTSTLIINTWDHLFFDLKEPNLHLQTEAAWNPATQELTLIKPLNAEYVLTNEKLQSLFTSSSSPLSSSPLSLAAPTTLSLTIDPFIWNLGTFQPADFYLNGHMSMQPFTITGGQRRATLQALNAQFTFNGKRQSLHTTLSITAGQAAQKLNFDLSFKGLPLTTAPAFDWKTIDADIKLNIEQFPSILLDSFASMFGEKEQLFSALFGESIQGNATLHMEQASGPVTVNLYSPNTRISLNGNLANGLFTLQDSFHAQMTMTPALSSALLKEANPLSLTALTTNHPITVEIDHQGFSVPLFPYDVKNINIPHLQIELGKVACQNEGNINIALGLLKSRQLSQEKQLNLWFTPIDIHIKNGLLDFERTEILVADTFEIALWGAIDLPKQQVDMALGLTAQCLKQAFGINSLPENYVMIVPMQGSLDNVKINTTAATAKITALLLWQQKGLGGGIGGGPAGAILGQFLNKLGPLPDSGANVPPAKHPFPWETTGRPKRSSDRKRSIKSGDKPLKQILKIFK